MHAMEEFYKQMLVKVSIPVAKLCKQLVALKENKLSDNGNCQFCVAAFLFILKDFFSSLWAKTLQFYFSSIFILN